MKVTITGDRLSVMREPGDAHARTSGYGGDGWSKEHHFMYMVKKALAEKLGINLVKVQAYKDGHLMDDRLPVLRPAIRSKPSPEHNIGIYDDNYMIRSAADVYNVGKVVTLRVVRDYLIKDREPR